MRGAELKEKLRNSPYSMAELAKMIGVSPQNLNASFSSEDVKSGVLEKLAKALDVPVSFFYGDSYTITGNNIVNSGSNNAVNATDERLLSLLVSKDEQLTMSMKQTEKAQSQMDELIAIMKGSR